MVRSTGSKKLNKPNHPDTLKTNKLELDEPEVDKKQLKKLGILNLSKHFKIKKQHANLLQKGLSFVPVNRTTPVEQFDIGIKKFIRNMKIKFNSITFNSKSTSQNRFRIPSTFQPALGTYPLEIDELEIL